MRLIPTSKRPCNLELGESRRVPQDPRFPIIGYHLCCPRCGFVSIAFQNHEGLVISEGATLGNVTFSKPLRCIYCAVLISVNDGNIRIEEDEHVRHLRFR
ncbi:MAG TPA: hypothetical protein VKP30_23195 [Polyangiaceae bacterium]|nr:hypothetical protein [Polyangiaceae bacterium]